MIGSAADESGAATPGRPDDPEPTGPPVLLPQEPVRVTWWLIGANVALFTLETWWGGSQWSPTLYRMGANAGREGLATEPWRVLSSAFLHIGVPHLLLNMWALLVFGQGLERLLGSARLLALYGVSALGGGLLSALAGRAPLSAGASGAVWGLMVAELVLLLRPRVLFQDLTFEVNKMVVLQPLVLNLLFSLQPGIDIMGHLGGGLAGGALMASGALALRRPGLWRTGASLAAAAMAASLVLALARGRPWELREPHLEPRRVEALGIVLPLPRGMQETERAADSIVFGDVPRDPILVECLRLDDAGQGTPEAPFHDSVTHKNGARSLVWEFHGSPRGLRLVVHHMPRLPPSWRGVPERIAAGLRRDQ